MSNSDLIINTIADEVRKGHCILFLGAGVHYPPPAPPDPPAPPPESYYEYPEIDRPPLGAALSLHLAQKCGLVDNEKEKDNLRNLQRVSLFYEVATSRNRLVQEIKEAVGGNKKPSPVVRALAQLNFPLVITTNYDQLFEQALRDAGKDPRVGVYSHNTIEKKTTVEHDGTEKRPFVYKIHGDLDILDSIVVTDEDYIQFILRMSDPMPYNPVPETFSFHFRRWPTLFVGYSLMDYNLRLLFKTLRWKMDKALIPDSYSVDLSPDPLIENVWQNERKYIRFVVQNVWDFVPKLFLKVTGNEMPGRKSSKKKSPAKVPAKSTKKGAKKTTRR